MIQKTIQMKNMMNIKRLWMAAVVASLVFFQLKNHSASAISEVTKSKIASREKRGLLPGRLGLGFGPFYTHYVLQKGLKK